MLAKFFRPQLTRYLMAGLLLFLAGLPLAAGQGYAAEAGQLHLRCTNPVGGANWLVVVDFDHALVDSMPATITSKRISWRNQKGGIFEFERATGNLQLSAPSTTGGYFLHYKCQPE
jgi:hypothetical protein